MARLARAFVVLTAVLAAALGLDVPRAEGAGKPDPLAAARQFYNLAQYDQAIAARGRRRVAAPRRPPPRT